MTRFCWILGLMLLAAPIARADDLSDPAADQNAALLDTFTDALSPVGQWVNMDGLGWCWRPSAATAGADFRPYATGGQWVLTTDGWVFQSRWDWGDIVFHYGRWYQDENYGWLWMPGTEWAPSWVEWRVTDDYAGWMPIPPDGLGDSAAPAWYFVPFAYFAGPDAYSHAISQDQVARVYVSAQRATSRGPSVEVVRSAGVAVTMRPGVRVVRPVPVRPLTNRTVHLTPLAHTRQGIAVPHRAMPVSRAASGSHRH